jgi:predicted hydrocarbon binding protein
MFDVAELSTQSLFWRNYFSFDAYVKGDTEFGLIENRSGSRLVALPEVLLQALVSTLKSETGQSAGLVLFKCGYRWGKKFYRRFNLEVSEFYQKPLAQMTMIQFVQCLKQCWKTHGWGLIEVDLNYHSQGFLAVQIQNSPLAQVAPSLPDRSGYLEAGILSAFFSQLTGRELQCLQTECESNGSSANQFIIGLAERLKPVEGWLSEGQDHRAILTRLCPNLTTTSFEGGLYG